MDYCNTVLAGAPRTVTDKLQRVLNAAARVITGTRKFDRGLRQILNDVPDRVLFELAVTVHQCLNGRAPPYLLEHCIPVSSADMRRHLCSANRHLGLLAVPYFRLNTRPSGVLCCWPDDLELSRIFFRERIPGHLGGNRAFTASATLVWNSISRSTRSSLVSITRRLQITSQDRAAVQLSHSNALSRRVYSVGLLY